METKQVKNFSDYFVSKGGIIYHNGEEVETFEDNEGDVAVVLRKGTRNKAYTLKVMDIVDAAWSDVNTPISDTKTVNNSDMAEFIRQENEVWSDSREKQVIHCKGLFGASSLDEFTAVFAKPRVIPDILAGNAETWVAPVGGCDYVLTKSGRRINMKHSSNDTRYNEETDGKPCGLSACKYLDLNDIEL